jgi:hypothetical protein
MTRRQTACVLMKQSCTKLRVTLWWTAGDLLRMFDDPETPKLCHLHLSQRYHMMENVLNSKGPSLSPAASSQSGTVEHYMTALVLQRAAAAASCFCFATRCYDIRQAHVGMTGCASEFCIAISAESEIDHFIMHPSPTLERSGVCV